MRGWERKRAHVKQNKQKFLTENLYTDSPGCIWTLGEAEAMLLKAGFSKQMAPKMAQNLYLTGDIFGADLEVDFGGAEKATTGGGMQKGGTAGGKKGGGDGPGLNAEADGFDGFGGTETAGAGGGGFGKVLKLERIKKEDLGGPDLQLLKDMFQIDLDNSVETSTTVETFLRREKLRAIGPNKDKDFSLMARVVAPEFGQTEKATKKEKASPMKKAKKAAKERKEAVVADIQKMTVDFSENFEKDTEFAKNVQQFLQKQNAGGKSDKKEDLLKDLETLAVKCSGDPELVLATEGFLRKEKKTSPGNAEKFLQQDLELLQQMVFESPEVAASFQQFLKKDKTVKKGMKEQDLGLDDTFDSRADLDETTEQAATGAGMFQAGKKRAKKAKANQEVAANLAALEQLVLENDDVAELVQKFVMEENQKLQTSTLWNYVPAEVETVSAGKGMMFQSISRKAPARAKAKAATPAPEGEGAKHPHHEGESEDAADESDEAEDSSFLESSREGDREAADDERAKTSNKKLVIRSADQHDEDELHETDFIEQTKRTRTTDSEDEHYTAHYTADPPRVSIRIRDRAAATEVMQLPSGLDRASRVSDGFEDASAVEADTHVSILNLIREKQASTDKQSAATKERENSGSSSSKKVSYSSSSSLKQKEISTPRRNLSTTRTNTTTTSGFGVASSSHADASDASCFSAWFPCCAKPEKPKVSGFMRMKASMKSEGRAQSVPSRSVSDDFMDSRDWSEPKRSNFQILPGPSFSSKMSSTKSKGAKASAGDASTRSRGEGEAVDVEGSSGSQSREEDGSEDSGTDDDHDEGSEKEKKAEGRRRRSFTEEHHMSILQRLSRGPDEIEVLEEQKSFITEESSKGILQRLSSEENPMTRKSVLFRFRPEAEQAREARLQCEQLVAGDTTGSTATRASAVEQNPRTSTTTLESTSTSIREEVIKNSESSSANETPTPRAVEMNTSPSAASRASKVSFDKNALRDSTSSESDNREGPGASGGDSGGGQSLGRSTVAFSTKAGTKTRASSASGRVSFRTAIRRPEGAASTVLSSRRRSIYTSKGGRSCASGALPKRRTTTGASPPSPSSIIGSQQIGFAASSTTSTLGRTSTTSLTTTGEEQVQRGVSPGRERTSIGSMRSPSASSMRKSVGSSKLNRLERQELERFLERAGGCSAAEAQRLAEESVRGEGVFLSDRQRIGILTREPGFLEVRSLQHLRNCLAAKRIAQNVDGVQTQVPEVSVVAAGVDADRPIDKEDTTSSSKEVGDKTQHELVKSTTPADGKQDVVVEAGAAPIKGQQQQAQSSKTSAGLLALMLQSKAREVLAEIDTSRTAGTTSQGVVAGSSATSSSTASPVQERRFSTGSMGSSTNPSRLSAPGSTITRSGVSFATERSLLGLSRVNLHTCFLSFAAETAFDASEVREVLSSELPTFVDALKKREKMRPTHSPGTSLGGTKELKERVINKHKETSSMMRLVQLVDNFNTSPRGRTSLKGGGIVHSGDIEQVVPGVGGGSSGGGPVDDRAEQGSSSSTEVDSAQLPDARALTKIGRRSCPPAILHAASIVERDLRQVMGMPASEAGAPPSIASPLRAVHRALEKASQERQGPPAAPLSPGKRLSREDFAKIAEEAELERHAESLLAFLASSEHPEVRMEGTNNPTSSDLVSRQDGQEATTTNHLSSDTPAGEPQPSSLPDQGNGKIAESTSTPEASANVRPPSSISKDANEQQDAEQREMVSGAFNGAATVLPSTGASRASASSTTSSVVVASGEEDVARKLAAGSLSSAYTALSRRDRAFLEQGCTTLLPLLHASTRGGLRCFLIANFAPSMPKTLENILKRIHETTPNALGPVLLRHLAAPD
ncbi:unnamed protein product [Amoebophrya sp. A25]|nr:unnamed protein product [Amoebophrya sp. A25]|eukprot:GSA25T00002781001.1